MKSFANTLALAALLTGCASLQSEHRQHDPIQSAQAFDVLKSLAGTWEGTMSDGSGGSSPVKLSYEVVSAGSAVMERLAAGTEHEMITIYHRDGAGLLMTHYCAMGNQPRMQLVSFSDKPGVTLSFAYVDATNLASPKQLVMHDMRLSKLDQDHFTTSWTAFVDGKPNHTGNFDYKRASVLSTQLQSNF